MILIKNVPLPLINGITLWPFVLCKTAYPDDILLNHERIHLRQQIELLVLPFYIIYLAEWLFYFVQYGNVWKAYRQISFEKEAYAKESNLDYLKSRKWYASFKYL